MNIKKKHVPTGKSSNAMVAVSFAILYALCCFVIFPVNVLMSDDVAFEGTVIPELIGYIGAVAEIVAIAVAYAAIVYTIYLGGKNGVKGIATIFAIATLCKYMLRTAIYWVIYGSISLEWGWDMANAVFYTALEFLQLLIVISVTSRILDKTRPSADGTESCFTQLYDGKNPLMRAALWCSVIAVATKILGSLADDVFTMVITGLPQNPETVILMLVNYVSNVIFGAVCYFVMLAVMIKLADKHEKNFE